MPFPGQLRLPSGRWLNTSALWKPCCLNPCSVDKLCITVRYGARTLEIVEGKNAIETDSIADVIASLQVIRSAVDAGELDRRIDAVMAQVKAGSAKEPETRGRSTLKLPSKPV